MKLNPRAQAAQILTLIAAAPADVSQVYIPDIYAGHFHRVPKDGRDYFVRERPPPDSLLGTVLVLTPQPLPPWVLPLPPPSLRPDPEFFDIEITFQRPWPTGRWLSLSGAEHSITQRAAHDSFLALLDLKPPSHGAHPVGALVRIVGAPRQL